MSKISIQRNIWFPFALNQRMLRVVKPAGYASISQFIIMAVRRLVTQEEKRLGISTKERRDGAGDKNQLELDFGETKVNP